MQPTANFRQTTTGCFCCSDIYLNLLLRLAVLLHSGCNKCACNNTTARQVSDVSQLFAIIWVWKREKMLKNKQNINKSNKSNKGKNRKAGRDACNIMKRSVNKVSALVPALIGYPTHTHTVTKAYYIHAYTCIYRVCCGILLRIRPEVLQYADVVEYFALS